MRLKQTSASAHLQIAKKADKTTTSNRQKKNAIEAKGESARVLTIEVHGGSHCGQQHDHNEIIEARQTRTILECGSVARKRSVIVSRSGVGHCVGAARALTVPLAVVAAKVGIGGEDFATFGNPVCGLQLKSTASERNILPFFWRTN